MKPQVRLIALAKSHPAGPVTELVGAVIARILAMKSKGVWMMRASPRSVGVSLLPISVARVSFVENGP